MNFLFIGNSHTYVNEVPRIVKDLFAEAGKQVNVSMVTQGGKSLLWHSEQRNASFNIRNGGYDAVILQDQATGFTAESFAEGLDRLVADGLAKVDSRRVLYMVWAHRNTPEMQPDMTAAYRAGAKKHNAALAPVGEIWYRLLAETPSLELFCEDGNHATPLGSYLAACTLFYLLANRTEPLLPDDDNAIAARLGLDPALCRRMHLAALDGLRAESNR